MKDIKYWIWFSRLENLAPKTLIRLLEKFKNPKELWRKTNQELITEGIKENHIKEITDVKYRNNLDKYLEYMVKNNIEIITIYDNEYPQKLKEIYDPPSVIYIKGNKKIINEKAIAIVGSRECTKYGEEITRKLAYNLSLNNINIISGLARGIDTCAHAGALKANGKTIAIVRVWVRPSVSTRKQRYL